MATPYVLVIGATQGTGQLITEQLLAAKTNLRVLARNVSKARERLGPQVDILPGDITKPDTLTAAFQGITDIVFTAGVTKRPASSALVQETESDGVRYTLAAARQHNLAGRFLYMTSIGVGQASPVAWLLNRLKGNTLHWRQEAEMAIRASGLAYTIVRCGVLTNQNAGQHEIDLTQGNQPLTVSTKISRGDVATVCITALWEPHAQNTTFEIIETKRPPTGDWQRRLRDLEPDSRGIDVRSKADFASR